MFSMYKAVHRIFGAYTVAIPAQDALRLINVLNKKRILTWGIKNCQDVFYIKASLFSCESVFRTAGEENIDISISKTIGIPFVFSKYKGRLGLILGSLAGLFLIFYSQLFVWDVKVVGNKNVSTNVITQTLAEYGVRRGAYIPKLNITDAELQLLMNYKDISSISINIKGTCAEIDLLERTYPPPIVSKTGFYNVVATDDGVIVKVEAADGSPEVRAGDAVVKGQLLINAYMQGRLGAFRITHARGTVTAKVTNKFSITIPLEQTEKFYTGDTQTATSVSVLGTTLDYLRRETTSFELYDVTVTQEEKKFFGILRTPVIVTTAFFKEYQINRYNISEEAAKVRASEAFTQYLAREKNKVVTYDCQGHYDKESNAYILDASVVVIKNIAVEQPIDFVG